MLVRQTTNTPFSLKSTFHQVPFSASSPFTCHQSLCLSLSLSLSSSCTILKPETPSWRVGWGNGKPTPILSLLPKNNF